MGGDFTLILFYPKLGQGSMFRSLHPGLTHMSIGHYWFGISFAAFMNLFFIILFKVLTYQRADIRGTRAVGEKRRIAWPEMLIVLFPLFGAINIITNALAYLRILEGNSGYVFLSVQVSAYQGGGKYCYHDSFYPKFHSNHIFVGEQSIIAPGGVLKGANISRVQVANEYLSRTVTYLMPNNKLKSLDVPFDGKKCFGRSIKWYEFFTYQISDRKDPDINKEVYFCRMWLKEMGIIEDERKKATINKLGHTGYGITSQGIDVNEPVFEDFRLGSKKLIIDPLRLFRSSGALVLPTRATVRLMSSSEDITHSGAVPGLGFKMDCVPGRLFCLYTNIVREGIYFGQCSELCGGNHYNMPVVVYALPVEHFIVGWEIELHAIFDEPCNMIQDYYSAEKTKLVRYSLLNVKYK